MARLPASARRSFDMHEFMRVEIEDDLITARYCAVPRPHEPPATPPRVADLFQLQLEANKLVRRADGALAAPGAAVSAVAALRRWISRWIRSRLPPAHERAGPGAASAHVRHGKDTSF